MTTAVEQVGIKIVLDATSVKTESQASIQVFEQFGKRVADAAESAARSMSAMATEITQVRAAQLQAADGATKEAAAQREATQARTVATDVQTRFIAGLREQITTHGMSAEALLRYRAAQVGAAQEAAPLILQLQNQRAAQLLAAEAASQEEAAQRQAAQAKRSALDSQTAFLAGLRDQVALQGKSSTDVLRHRAGQLGVGDDAEVFIRQIEKVEGGTKRMGVSAGQTQAALRMLPAQITDISTSIAGGMPLWLIAVQQGGQIKDSFGGIGPTVRTLLGLLTPLRVAIGGAAAAATVLGVAYYQGSREASAYREALVMSGNAAGTTVGRLTDMARAISTVSGTQGAAAAGLAEMAGSGKVGAENLQRFTSVALDLERFVGVPVKKTVDDLAELGKEPVKASIKLNEQYNYLTAAVYAQIKALTDQGRQEEAVALAQRTYIAAMEQRKNQIVANLGVMERAWNSVKNGAKAAWDAMLNVGRTETTQQQLDAVGEKIARVRKANEGGGFGETGGGAAVGNPRIALNRQRELDSLLQQQAALQEMARVQKRDAEGQANRVRVENEGIAASTFLSDIRKRIDKTGEAKKAVEHYRKAISDAQAAGLPVPSAAGQKKEIAAIEKEFGPKGGAPKAYQDDAATRMLQQLKDSNAAVLTQLASQDKLTDAQKKQAEFLQLIADLKGKTILTADQKSLLAGADRIKAQLAENVLNEKLLDIKKQGAKVDEERKKALEQYAQAAAGVMISLRSAEQSRGEQYDRSLDVIGLGSQARERVESTKSIRRDYQRFEDQLTKDAASKDLLGTAKYRSDVELVRQALKDALQANDNYYSQITAKQADWSNGAKESWSNYLDSARDVAGQTKSAFDSGFKGMEDALVTFGTTGKLSFKSLADSVISDLIRIQVRSAMTSALGGGSAGSGGIGWLSTLFGGTSSIAGANLSTSFVKSVGMSAAGIVPMAKGGVFASPSLSAYSNGIYDTPRPFAFAKGAGIFGEAGPEAIMPLRRGADGRLGVSVQSGGGAAPSMQFAPTNNFYVDSRSDRGAILADMGRVTAENNRAQMDQLKRMKVVPQ